MENGKGNDSHSPSTLGSCREQGSAVGRRERGPQRTLLLGQGVTRRGGSGESTSGAQLVVRLDGVTLAAKATPSEPSAPLAGALTDTEKTEERKGLWRKQLSVQRTQVSVTGLGNSRGKSSWPGAWRPEGHQPARHLKPQGLRAFSGKLSDA